jgi:ABC-2 type transport system permease protein
MSRLASVWKKEFRSYWISPIAYIVIAVFLVLMNWLYFRGLFISNEASMRSFFGLLPWTYLFLIPALTMRQWAEEFRSGTIETLMTKPIREWEAVLGKYLASLAFLVVILLMTIPVAITVHFLSETGLDWGVLFANYLGALLLGAACLAIGGWIGSMTSNQIVAFILAVAVIFAAIMVGKEVVTLFAPTFLVPLLEYLGLESHYISIARGVIDTQDLIYYFSVVFLFAYLTVRSVESRKWS